MKAMNLSHKFVSVYGQGHKLQLPYSLNRASYNVSVFFLTAYLMTSGVKSTKARFIEEKVNSAAKNSS